MAKQVRDELIAAIERAKKVLQHEQRTHHQDKAIRPGGVETFANFWANNFGESCKKVGLDLTPVQRFLEHLEGYHNQDPMQRAASLRAALAVLNELGTSYGFSPTSPHAVASTITREMPDAKNAKGHIPPVLAERGTGAVQPEGKPPAQSSQGTPPALRHSGRKSARSVSVTSSPILLEDGMSPGHTVLTLLSADVTAIPGVGTTVAAKLRHLNIRTVRDLLFYFPREHRDYSKLTKISDIPFGELTTTMGLIWEVSTRRTSGGRSLTTATISDETGKLHVSWFNQAYLQKQLKAAQGDRLVVTGIKQRFGNKVDFSVRSHEFPDQQDLLNTGRLVPIYSLTEGLHAKALRRFTKWAVDHYAQMVPEYLPRSILSAGQLLPLSEAIAHIHYPENEEMLQAARRRLAFDELFMIQLGMQERRSRWGQTVSEGNAFKVDFGKIFTEFVAEENVAEARSEAETEETETVPSSTLWATVATDQPFEATLPFPFTPAQRRVIYEIGNDLAKSKPMCRLLQGDVGAGKTVVAATALLIAAQNGYQGAIMAPTELLAEQHARSISAMLEPYGIQTVLLTGNLRSRERAMGRAALESGQAMVAIGTHALIQEDISFDRLGLVIIDEQHRFGVEQRDALRQKGYHPHMLVMTATPIPRTLALTLYGDLDVSIIDQLPPGRQKIITRWRSGARRNEANTIIAQQVTEGHQAFIICPLIEESEALSAKAATTEYERLQQEVFPHLRLGLLHGGMKASEKDHIMRQFRDHELEILVATSVIEVGIDVPNATVMVIEDADRFGLSQLHQFRGRVGRGQHQSYCYVLSADASIQAQERLGIFQEIDDGFRLAEEDLRLRGPGDFIGVRQSGMPELRIADLSDTPLIELARLLAAKLWESDPYLRKIEHKPLREKMYLFWQSFMSH